MAFARDTFTATGGQTVFTITYNYLLTSHVVVTVNGSTKTEGASSDYTISSATLTFISGLTNGDAVVLTRSTSRSTRLTDYAAASTLTETDLDNDSLQAFYMAQESIDRAVLSLGLSTSDVHWDATTLKIHNVVDPTADQDAATKAYADALSIADGNVVAPVNPTDDSKVLTAGSGAWTWESAATSVVTTRGDVVRGDSSGNAERLAVGTTGQMLTTDGTDVSWGNVTGDVVTTRGDIIRGDSGGGDPERLAIGASGYVLTSDGTDAAWAASAGGFASGTVMLFVQTSAPTGWTKGATHNNKALRLITGSVGTGGATAFTTAFANGRATGSASPGFASHAHVQGDGQNDNGGAATSRSRLRTAIDGGTDVTSTANTGSGSAHTHTMSVEVQYVDVILATKD